MKHLSSRNMPNKIFYTSTNLPIKTIRIWLFLRREKKLKIQTADIEFLIFL